VTSQIGADQAQRAAVAVALDLGDDADPAGRAVIRPHDAVFGRIVLALALQHAEQVLGPFARDPSGWIRLTHSS
jgi:hypothetical protein